jgi:putative oxidoreductase
MEGIEMTDVAILLLRMAVGLTLAAHGSQKLFGWFGGPGINGFRGMLEHMNFRGAGVWAAFAALAELGGGLLIAFGFLTPLGSFAVIAAMMVAIATVHSSKGFFNSHGGYEFPVLILVSALAIAIMGPGTASADAYLGLDYPLPLVGFFIVISIGGALFALGSRQFVRKERRQAQEDRRRTPAGQS